MMKNLVKFLGIFSVLCTTSLMYANGGKPVKRYESRTIGNLTFSETTLLDDRRILTFVSHPRAMQHFWEGSQKMLDLEMLTKFRLDQLKVEFPNDELVEYAYQQTSQEVKKLCDPILNIIAPMLVFGMGDASGISNIADRHAVQALQIKIFKNWLARYKIGIYNPYLFEEVQEYAERSPFDLFYKVIRPLFNEMVSRELAHDFPLPDFYDVVRLFIPHDDLADYDETRRLDLEKSNKEKGDQLEDDPFGLLAIFKSQQAAINDAIAKQIEEQLKATFTQSTKKYQDPHVEEALRKLYNEVTPVSDLIFEKYFSRDAIILLFLEITKS